MQRIGTTGPRIAHALAASSLLIAVTANAGTTFFGDPSQLNCGIFTHCAYVNPAGSTASLAAGDVFAPIDLNLSNFTNFGVYNNRGYTYTAGLFDNAGFTNSGAASTFNNLGAASELSFTHGSNEGLISNEGLLGINWVLDPATGLFRSGNSPFAMLTNTGTIDNSGTIRDAGSLVNSSSGSITNESGGVFEAGYNATPGGPGLYAIVLTNDGLVTNRGLLSNGPIGGGGQLSSTIVNSAAGQIVNDAAGILGSFSGNLTNYDVIKNSGVIENVNSSVFANFGLVENTSTSASGGQLLVESRSLFANYGLIRNGQLSTSGSAALLFNDANLDNSGTIENNGLLTNSGQIENHNAGALVTNNGEIQNSVTGSIANDAQLTNAGTVTNLGLIENGSAGTLSNSGQLENASGATIENAGLLTNVVGGSINNLGQIINLPSGTLIASGEMLSSGQITNSGLVEITPGGGILGSGTYVQNAGKTRVNGELSQAAVYNNGGVFSGGGVVNGTALNPSAPPVNFHNDGGTIAPGDPVTLTIDGNLFFTAGLLDIKIASLSEFDRLVVTGFASFTGGTVLLDFIDGYEPLTGDSFQFLTSPSLFFNITDVQVHGVRPGFEFMLDIANGGLNFTVTNDGVEPVPLPAAAWLLLSGLGALGVIARRRRFTDAPT